MYQVAPFRSGIVFYARLDLMTGGLFVVDPQGAGTVEVFRGTVHDFGVLGDVVLFQVEGPTGFDLWRSDGTVGGTSLLKAGLVAQGFHDYAGWLWFSGDDGVQGTELWRSDGTVAGTGLFADLVPGPGSSFPSQFTTVGSRMMLTAAGNVFVVDDANSAPRQVAAMLGLDPVVHGREVWSFTNISGTWALWVTDGTAAGTQQVSVLPSGHWGIGIAPLDDRVVFATGTFLTNQFDLWSTDGTPGAEVHLGSFDQLRVPHSFGTTRAWFSATVGGESRLWSSDGTVAGTLPVPAPASLVSGPRTPFALAHGKLIFAALHDWFGHELWTLAPGASAQPLEPDGRCASWLDGSPPVLGTSARVDAWSLPPAGVAVLMLGLPHEPPLPLPGTCGVVIDPAACWKIGVFPTGSGEVTTNVDLPSIPELHGFAVNLQAWSAPFANALGFEVSAPLRWTLGL